MAPTEVRVSATSCTVTTAAWPPAPCIRAAICTGATARLPWFGFDRLAVCDGGHGFGRRFARCLAKGLPVLLKRADVMCTVVYECVPLCTGTLSHVWEKKRSTCHAPLVVQGFTQIAVDHAREMLLVRSHCG